MEFASVRQQEVYDRIGPWLVELFGEPRVFAKEAYPGFALPWGTAVVHVAAQPWLEDDCYIDVLSWVAVGPEVTPELMQFLLNQNEGFVVGGFGLDDEGDVFFRYAVHGASATREALAQAIQAVGEAADRYDDEIVARWGGTRAADR